MSNFDASPSAQWKLIQKNLDAPNHSIQMSELESYQRVMITESNVKQCVWEVDKKNDLETTQQVSSVTKPSIQMPRNKQYLKYMIEQQKIEEKEPEITHSSSQLNFASAGQSKTFISSNAIIGSATSSRKSTHTKLSSQSSYHMADSTNAFISSHKNLSQRMEELHQQSAMLPFDPPKTLSRTKIIKLNGLVLKPFTGDESGFKSSTRGNSMKSPSSRSECAGTVTSNGATKSKELTYWPKESYVESSYVPGIPNNKFMFHSQQQNENNDSTTPEQSTFATKSSIKSQLQTLSETFKSVDVEQSTDNETSKSLLEEGCGTKHSPSPVQAGLPQKKLTSAESGGTTLRQEQQPLPLQFEQSSNESLQRTPARNYISKEQESPVKIPVTASNQVVIESNELIDFPKTRRVDSTYPAYVPKNELPQAANKETLKSNDLTPQSPAGEESILKPSPSRAGSSDAANSFNETNKSSISGDESQIKLQSSQSTEILADIKNAPITFSDIIPEEITPGQEYQLQLLPIQFTDTQSSLSKEHTTWNELLRETSTSGLNSKSSQPLTAQSFNSDEQSNEPIIFTVGNDDVLDYPEMQGVEYEVTLPADQPHYQTVPITEIESSTVGIQPVKTTKKANKVIIESNVLIAPPKKSDVKSIYAGAIPKNPRKNSKPTTSTAGPMIGSTRLNLQSKLPRIVGGADATQTTQSNVALHGSIQHPAPAVKLPMKQLTGKVINEPITHQKSRNVNPVQQGNKPHPLPKKTVTFDTKSTSTSLKRKLKENILPIVPSKKPLLQDPKELQITMHDKTFRLPDVSIERVTIVGGIEKKQTVRNLKFTTPSEPNANKMSFSDCMDTLLRNNIHVFKVPMSPNNILDKYLKTLEKNNVRVTKIKK